MFRATVETGPEGSKYELKGRKGQKEGGIVCTDFFINECQGELTCEAPLDREEILRWKEEDQILYHNIQPTQEGWVFRSSSAQVDIL